MYFLVGEYISRLQSRMEHHLNEAPLATWECIKLSNVLWLSLDDNKSNWYGNAIYWLYTSLLLEARGCLVTYALSVELDIACYDVTCMSIISSVTNGAKVCRQFLSKTMVHTVTKKNFFQNRKQVFGVSCDHFQNCHLKFWEPCFIICL